MGNSVTDSVQMSGSEFSGFGLKSLFNSNECVDFEGSDDTNNNIDEQRLKSLSKRTPIN